MQKKLIRPGIQMKKTVGAVLLFVFIILVILPYIQGFFGNEYYYVHFKNVLLLQQYLNYSPNSAPLVAAHRGGPEPGYPENCLETFQHSLKYAPCLIECDVRRTKDSILVLMHDEGISRTTTGRGNIHEYSFKELRKLTLVDPGGKITDYKIPSLQEALVWAKGRAILELDVKSDVQPWEINEILQKNDAFSCVLVITYTLGQLQNYAAIHPGLMISAAAHTREGVQRILDAGIDPDRLLIYVGVTEPGSEVYWMLHQLGIRSILGTMHNIDRAAEKRGIKVYLEVLKKGADVLATDNIPLASKAIMTLNRENNLVNQFQEKGANLPFTPYVK